MSREDPGTAAPSFLSPLLALPGSHCEVAKSTFRLFLLDWFTDPKDNLSALGSRARMDSKSGLQVFGEENGGRRLVLILHTVDDH